jgi:hypothetical protein
VRSAIEADLVFLFLSQFTRSLAMIPTLKPIPRFSAVTIILTACLLTGSGCGGSKEKTVAVSGKVTHKGQPVVGIVVSFVPQAATETGASTGETDDQGAYELRVAKTGSKGAVVGTHKVWVSLPREEPKPVDEEERIKKSKQRKANPLPTKKATGNATANQPAEVTEILNKYGNPEKSPLSVEVKSGEPIDIKLD